MECLLHVSASDACDNDTTSDLRGLFSWPDTRVGQTRVITCPVQQSGFEAARASRLCTMGSDGSSAWGNPSTFDCPYESVTTQQLQQLSRVM